MASERKPEAWGSKLGVILAVAGSAVGLGNFLRFPGNAAQHGGGAFMIPYFCALIFLGIPIGWAEWAMGRYGGRKGFHSAPAIMGVFGRGAVGRYLGIVAVLIPLVVYFYYVLIESWCLSYCWNYAVGGGVGIAHDQGVREQVAASSAFFTQQSGQGANGSNFFAVQDGAETGGISQALIFWGITFALNIYFVFRGLSKGIEWFCSWAMPSMAVIGLIVLVRVLTLGTPDPALPEQNVVNGLGFMWNPDFEKLGDFETWLAAAGQIFFSLSVGFGVIINYSSYMKKDDDVVLSGLTSSATNEFFEVCLGGLITLTAAVVFLGIGLTQQNTGGTFSTGFTTLPVVFAHMPFGRFFGAIWFFMLFLAAITSSLSMLQPAKAFFAEALGLSNLGATSLVAILAVAGNLFVLWYSQGLNALDTIDFWVGTFFIFIMAAVQIICFGWVFGMERGMEEAHRGARMRIPKVYQFIIKYVAPVYLLVVFVGFCLQSVPPYLRTLFGETAPATIARIDTNGDSMLDAEELENAEDAKVNARDADQDGAVTLAELGEGFDADLTAQKSWLVILSSLALLVVCTHLGARRWKKLGLDLNGDRPAED